MPSDPVWVHLDDPQPEETRWFVTGDAREALELHPQPTVALRR